jgi:hypothetical protein
LAPSDQVNLAWLRALDVTAAWTFRVKERFNDQAVNRFFNAPNFSNFDLPGSMMSGLLTVGAGSINGTNKAGHFVNRVGVGTGVYTLGRHGELEFGLKLTF